MLLAPAMYKELLRGDLSAFNHRSFLQLNPSAAFLHNWHIDFIAAKLEEVRRGTCKRLIITLPPRHLKSHAVSVTWPAWVLGQDPFKKILVVTYAQDFSDKLARDFREVMRSPFYQALFATRPASEAISEYETTAGGYRLSTSVAGGLTGRGADIIIIDDPLKADDALSEARRKSVNEWYDNTLRSRLNSQEDGAIILVMQRLHADDLVAHVQQHEHWDVVSLPAIAEQNETHAFTTPYGARIVHRKEGEVLHPGIISRERLDALRRGMTDYNFAAQFQQNPQPASGIIVKREWLRFYTPAEKPKQFDRVIQSWDTANKDTELADYSVCTTWGFFERRMYLLDVYRAKLDFPSLKRAVKYQVSLHRPAIVLIEDKASGISLIQELHDEHYSIVQAAPKMDGDKIMRLRSQTAKIEAGFMMLPTDAPWLPAFVQELISFPNTKYDDQVDSAVFALAWSSSTSRYGWTDQSIAALRSLGESMAFDAWIGRQIGRPW